MKKNSLAGILLSVAVAVSMTACGNGGESEISSKESETVEDIAATREEEIKEESEEAYDDLTASETETETEDAFEKGEAPDAVLIGYRELTFDEEEKTSVYVTYPRIELQGEGLSKKLKEAIDQFNTDMASAGEADSASFMDWVNDDDELESYHPPVYERTRSLALRRADDRVLSFVMYSYSLRYFIFR